MFSIPLGKENMLLLYGLDRIEWNLDLKLFLTKERFMLAITANTY